MFLCLVASQEEGCEAGDCGDRRVLPLLVPTPDPHVPRHLLHRHQGIVGIIGNIITIARMFYLVHSSALLSQSPMA